MIVRCPRCRNSMNYGPKKGSLTEKTKRCVYCGRNFKVHIPGDSRVVDPKAFK